MDGCLLVHDVIEVQRHVSIKDDIMLPTLERRRCDEMLQSLSLAKRRGNSDKVHKQASAQLSPMLWGGIVLCVYVPPMNGAVFSALIKPKQ